MGFYFLTFYFILPVNNVVIVSGEQRKDPAIHVRVSILLPTPFPSRLPCDIAQSSQGWARWVFLKSQTLSVP